MNRYVIRFTKTGYAKYTSHLDILRLFKRAFKKTGIELKYSQGYNPHPKMSFAQPLSLGYASNYELLEFETVIPYSTDAVIEMLTPAMPEGIRILSANMLPDGVKSLAGDCVAASYKIWIPLDLSEKELKEGLSRYMKQDEIITLKRMKKSKALEPVNIKPMIRSIDISKVGEFALVEANLNSGSQSNLSPELVINSLQNTLGTEVLRHDIEVERTILEFNSNLHF